MFCDQFWNHSKYWTIFAADTRQCIQSWYVYLEFQCCYTWNRLHIIFIIRLLVKCSHTMIYWCDTGKCKIYIILWTHVVMSFRYFLVEDKHLSVPNGCWWTGDARSQDIGGHGIDTENSGFCSRKVCVVPLKWHDYRNLGICHTIKLQSTD